MQYPQIRSSADRPRRRFALRQLHHQRHVFCFPPHINILWLFKVCTRGTSILQIFYFFFSIFSATPHPIREEQSVFFYYLQKGGSKGEGANIYATHTHMRVSQGHGKHPEEGKNKAIFFPPTPPPPPLPPPPPPSSPTKITGKGVVGWVLAFPFLSLPSRLGPSSRKKRCSPTARDGARCRVCSTAPFCCLQP